MWSILVAAIAMFIFGAIWFMTFFGKMWAKLMGFTAENMSPEDIAKAKEMGMTKPLIANFLTNIIIASVVYYLYPQVLALTFVEFWKIVLIIWLGFSFPIYANQSIWERKSWKVALLNSVQGIISVTIVSSIIYFMQ